MNQKWPLHPQPASYQLLRHWIENLAEAYEVSYKSFCKNALKLNPEEINTLSRSPPEKALIILSNGTGVAIADLRERSLYAMWKLLLQELAKSLEENPESFLFKKVYKT